MSEHNHYYPPSDMHPRDIDSRLAIEQRCMFGCHNRCGNGAVYHFMLVGDHLPQGEIMQMTCEAHWEWWNRHSGNVRDFHEIGSSCGLPEARWRYSQVEAGDGECVTDFGGVYEHLGSADRMVKA